ncbi:hypothetical protein AZ78_0769 [Lysobacter capsici AZ78]|uniref:Uncharacterized protein n=1 Tax=Lysobacter capsici AZ78 TaxID=1444315 RepID=A0A108U626_9GAMM|nr:hypothetical protein AZ78_0769 [Lysobacter capsici AZ78]
MHRGFQGLLAIEPARPSARPAWRRFAGRIAPAGWCRICNIYFHSDRY